MTGSVAAGRDLHKQLHTRTTDTNPEAPNRNDKSVAAGRALFNAKGKYATDTVQLGANGTDV